MNTSALRTSRISTSRPPGVRRSSARPRLLRFIDGTQAPPKCGRKCSPCNGSTLITSAPMSPRIWPAVGPAMTCVRSRTSVSVSGCMTRAVAALAHSRHSVSVLVSHPTISGVAMTSDRPNLRIDSDRLWGSLMELAKIGATEKGGVCRIALTDLDRQGRDLFVRWAKAAGATIKIDQLGNIFARREGRDPGKAPIMTGSHLDTQPTGGKFDGAYGVMAGLEVLRVLHDSNYVTEAPIEVAVWTNEEIGRAHV